MKIWPFSDARVWSHTEKALEFIAGKGLMQAPTNAAVVPGVAANSLNGELPLEEVQLSWLLPA